MVSSLDFHAPSSPSDSEFYRWTDPRWLSCLSVVDRRINFRNFVDSGTEVERPSSLAWDQASAIFEQCRRHGAEILYPGHPLYPVPFSFLERPPCFLTYRGHACWNDLPALAVVGSREPHVRALEWMDQHLGPLLRKRSMLVVSGAARGVDQRAHLLSVRLGLPTLALLPAGLGRCYPETFEALCEDVIAVGGAVMSEYPPETEMRKHHFHQRNRLIAGLARVLLVVEAGRRSGSLMTARLAQAGNTRVCVLPSFPGDGAGSGTLELLMEGATPLRDGDDLRAICEMEFISTSVGAPK